MKTVRINKLARLAMSLALFAGGAGMIVAGQTSIKGGAAQVIQLPASNNSVQTVTIWISKTTPRSTDTIATAKNGAAKVIELHAPNSPGQSVTVWTSRPEKKFEVAPLK